MSTPTNPAPESAGGKCADCQHKTGMHYMRQNGSFGCRLCSSASEHHPAEIAGHTHTYNMAGVCVTCGHDADALATDHHFCENDDSPTRGATMVLDLLARIVTSDRDDADVGLMVRRVLNEPTLKAIRKAASTPAAPQPETEGMTLADFLLDCGVGRPWFTNGLTDAGQRKQLVEWIAAWTAAKKGGR